MNLEFLDFDTYTFVGGFTVQRGKDLIIPKSLVLSEVMLVKWQIRQLVKGATIEEIPFAILSAALEIPGLGILNHTDTEILASQLGKDVVQFWTIDPGLPYRIKFSQVSDLVTNSVLEFYSSDLNMAITNNIGGVKVDMTAVTDAIAAGAAAQVAATEAVQTVQTRKVQSIVESVYSASVWSNTASNHIAFPPDPSRMGAILVNTSSERVYYDTYIDISNKTVEPQYDSFMEPNGIINIGQDEAGLGVLLYTLGGGGTASVSINLQSYTPTVSVPQA